MTAREITVALGGAQVDSGHAGARYTIASVSSLAMQMGAADSHFDRNSRARPISDPPHFVTVLTTKGPLATKQIIWALGGTKPTIEPSETRS